jgi:hypothetical protein
LTIQRLARGCHWEASCKSSGAEFGRSTAWGKDSSDSNIFDERRIDLRALEEGFESTDKEIG